ncbi:hypothetical protein YC2023_058248 [Brassica napus]
MLGCERKPSAQSKQSKTREPLARLKPLRTNELTPHIPNRRTYASREWTSQGIGKRGFEVKRQSRRPLRRHRQPTNSPANSKHKARCRGRETHRHTLWLEEENQRPTRTKKLQPKPNDTLVRKERPIDDLGESNQTSSSREEETYQILEEAEKPPETPNPLQRSNLRSQTLTHKLVHIDGEAGQSKQQQQRITETRGRSLRRRYAHGRATVRRGKVSFTLSNFCEREDKEERLFCGVNLKVHPRSFVPNNAKNVGFKPYKAPTASMFPSHHAPLSLMSLSLIHTAP